MDSNGIDIGPKPILKVIIELIERLYDI